MGLAPVCGSYTNCKRHTLSISFPKPAVHYKLFSPNHQAAPVHLPSTLVTLAASAHPQPRTKTKNGVSLRAGGCSIFPVMAVCLRTALKGGTAGLWEVGRSQNTAKTSDSQQISVAPKEPGSAQPQHMSACTLLTLSSARIFKGALTPEKELKLCH